MAANLETDQNRTTTLRFGSLDPLVFKRAWNWGIFASMCCMIYTSICIGAPRTKYLNDIGMTAYHFGIIAALSSLSWGFQIVAGIIGLKLTA